MSVKTVGTSSQGSFHGIFSSGKIKTHSVILMLFVLFASFAPQFARSEELQQSPNTELITAQRTKTIHTYTPALATTALVAAANLPSGTVGVPYTGSITITGGVAPYTFLVTAGALPSGLFMDSSTGIISGTPAVAITKSFWVKFSDSQGNSGKLHTQITIAAAVSSQASITVAVSPSSLSLASGGSQQFSATVQGTSNTAVTWSASAGRISSSGLFTAPAVTSNTSVTVTASSAADPTQNASAYVTVTAPATPITISLSPASTTIASGASKQFTASVQGTTNTAVNWASSSGSISSSGVFTAPVVSSNTTVSVSATSAADPSKQAVASVSVTAPVPVTVSVNPSSISIPSGETMQFAAVVQGASSTAVNWSASAGTISSAGLFTAPSVTNSTTVSVTATSAADPTQSASASVSVSAASSPSYNMGCGVGPAGTNVADQSTCGNYSGAPYEDLDTASPTTPPAPIGAGTVHLISGCTMITPTEGDVWRFSGNVSDGANGTNPNCIHFSGQGSSDWVLDLAGHTLTGGIKFDQNDGGNGIGGVTIVNGAINCNIANGSAEGCITLLNGSSPTSSLLLSHLTVHNLNSLVNKDNGYSGFQFAIMISLGGTTTNTCTPGAQQKMFNGNCVELAHVEAVNAYGYTGASYTTGWCARCTDIYVAGNGAVSAELWNSVTVCGGWVDACQGTVFFNLGPAIAHNNYCNWTLYQGSSDSGRCFLFDAAGKPFNQNGGQAYYNLIETYNNRGIRTRQVNNVWIHDNRFEHVQSSVVFPAIQMGGNGDYAEKLDKNLVSNNTFIMAGGTAIQAATSYGAVADSNIFSCDSNCSSGYLGSSWINEGGAAGLVYSITSASRTSACVVTLTLSGGPATTSVINGVVYVNVSGRSDDFNVSGTAGNLLTTASGSTITYTQAGCLGANTGGAGGTFWMAQSKVDNFPANGAEIYVKNSIVDPQLTMSMPFVACGSANPTCTNPPQYTQIKWCNNMQDTTLIPALGGTGAVVTHITPDSACP